VIWQWNRMRLAEAAFKKRKVDLSAMDNNEFQAWYQS